MGEIWGLRLGFGRRRLFDFADGVLGPWGYLDAGRGFIVVKLLRGWLLLMVEIRLLFLLCLVLLKGLLPTLSLVHLE